MLNGLNFMIDTLITDDNRNFIIFDFLTDIFFLDPFLDSFPFLIFIKNVVMILLILFTEASMAKMENGIIANMLCSKDICAAALFEWIVENKEFHILRACFPQLCCQVETVWKHRFVHLQNNFSIFVVLDSVCNWVDGLRVNDSAHVFLLLL